MITINHRGSFSKTDKFFNKLLNRSYLNALEYYGKVGVDALSSATPIDTGLTASSWGYEIHHTKDVTSITWTNSNVNKGVPVAIILQYGHGTGTGGYVQGIDYINPALRPIFKDILDGVWREVTNL